MPRMRLTPKPETWSTDLRELQKHFLSDETDAEAAKEVELSEIVKPVPVQVATATTQIKCVYGQDMDEINLQDYVKNADAVGGVSVKVATGSTMLDGMQLDGNKISGKPAKTYTDGREVTFTFTAKNGNTANLTLNFLVAKADPTVKVAVDGDSHTEGDLVSELKLILSGNNTKGAAKIVSELKKLIAGKNTLAWEFTPEDSENYNVVTGTVVVNATRPLPQPPPRQQLPLLQTKRLPLPRQQLPPAERLLRPRQRLLPAEQPRQLRQLLPQTKRRQQLKKLLPQTKQPQQPKKLLQTKRL